MQYSRLRDSPSSVSYSYGVIVEHFVLGLGGQWGFFGVGEVDLSVEAAVVVPGNTGGILGKDHRINYLHLMRVAVLWLPRDIFFADYFHRPRKFQKRKGRNCLRLGAREGVAGAKGILAKGFANLR